jgi:hypothetical protein
VTDRSDGDALPAARFVADEGAVAISWQTAPPRKEKSRPTKSRRAKGPAAENAEAVAVVPEALVLEPPMEVVEPPVPQVVEPPAPEPLVEVVEPPTPEPLIEAVEPSAPEPEEVAPPIVEDEPDVRTSAWPAKPTELRSEAGRPIRRSRRNFRWKWAAGAAVLTALAGVAILTAVLVVPDLIHASEGSTGPTLTVAAERPVSTSRRFAVTVKNLTDRPVVASCTATVMNAAGTKEVATSAFTVGPIPSMGSAPHNGRVRLVHKKPRMGPGISVGCSQQPD